MFLWRAALLVCVLGCALACGCRNEPQRIAALDGEVHDARGPSELLADVRTREDLAREDGHRVRVHGFYEIEPVRTKGHAVALVLVDGTRVIRAYGAVDGELRLADRRVIATGVVHARAPDSAKEALAGPHVTVERIELALGEQAIEPPPTEIPVPPLASAGPALAGRLDRYVQLVGRLEAIAPNGDATLRLADGASVRVEHVPVAHWSTHVGTTVTVVGRIEVDRSTLPGPAGGFALSLVIRSRTAICGGVVPRCAG